MDADQQFVQDVVEAIVNNPGDVKTTRTVDERGVLITLDLHPSDMGYVIGRQGQTARSIRTLLKIVGAKNNARVNLKINEPVGGRGPSYASANTAGITSAPSVPSAPRVVHEDIDTSAVDSLNI